MRARQRASRRWSQTDRYCIDIVQQLTALSAAAEEVALLVLEGHIEGCVADAIREEHGEEHIQELMRTIRKAITQMSTRPARRGGGLW